MKKQLPQDSSVLAALQGARPAGSPPIRRKLDSTQHLPGRSTNLSISTSPTTSVVPTPPSTHGTFPESDATTAAASISAFIELATGAAVASREAILGEETSDGEETTTKTGRVAGGAAVLESILAWIFVFLLTLTGIADFPRRPGLSNNALQHCGPMTLTAEVDDTTTTSTSIVIKIIVEVLVVERDKPRSWEGFVSISLVLVSLLIPLLVLLKHITGSRRHREEPLTSPPQMTGVKHTGCHAGSGQRNGAFDSDY